MLLSGPAANFLVKELDATQRSGKPSRPELAYLSRRGDEGAQNRMSSGDFSKAETQLEIIGHRASRLVHALHELRRASSSGSDGGDGSLIAHLDARLAARASKAHGHYFIVYSFIATIASLRKNRGESVGVVLDDKLLNALERVRSLYALEVCILDDIGEYTEDGYLGRESILKVQKESARLMGEIRPDLLGLVEAADLNDWYLASPLGSSDGRAYERMIDFMKREPINQMGETGGRDDSGVLKGFRQVIGTLTHGEVEPWNQEEADKREKERQVERMTKL
jgi:hypothetical protein